MMQRLQTLNTVALVGGGLSLAAGVFMPGVLWAGIGLCLAAHAAALALIVTETRPVAGETAPAPAAHPKVVGQLEVTSVELGKAVAAINDVTQEGAVNASDQAEVIERTKALLEEFLTLSDRVSEQARSIAQVAGETTAAAAAGQAAIGASIGVMDDIRRQVVVIAETIATLARLTRRIETIITSVSEIATQSNVLALNASIEAARAGVHGRGFAVVADEVRVLAGQSTAAAGQVRTLLREVQGAIAEAIEAAQTGMQEVSDGVIQTRQADETIQQIAVEVRNSDEATHAIYAAIRQQAEGMETITINVERINHITQQNRAGMQVMRTVSANLTRLSDELERTLADGSPPNSPGR